MPFRGLGEWVGLPPAIAARHVHESGMDPAHIDRWQGISTFVTPSLLWSLYAFLRSPDDYWETICTAIGVGGDTDTMAAIAGAISGARLGAKALPGELLGWLNDRGSGEQRRSPSWPAHVPRLSIRPGDVWGVPSGSKRVILAKADPAIHVGSR